MIRGVQVDLRARWAADVEVLQAGLYDDVAVRVQADRRPWRPVPPGSPASPYAVQDRQDDASLFTVVDRPSGQVAGECLLWGIDTHNRSGHLGLALLPEQRGRGLAVDVLQVLCGYGFAVLGLNRLQLETLPGNEPMVRAARRAGFTAEGTRRQAAWVYGAFADEVVFARLAQDPG